MIVPAEPPGPQLAWLTGPRTLVLGVGVGTLPLTGVTQPAGAGSRLVRMGRCFSGHISDVFRRWPPQAVAGHGLRGQG